jgi:hypothetical protein
MVDADRRREPSQRAQRRTGARLDHRPDPLGDRLSGFVAFLLRQRADLEGAVAQPQRQDRVILELLQPALRPSQGGVGTPRQLVRAERPAGAQHATAGQRQPLVGGQPRPQVQVPVGGQHPCLSFLGAEQVAEDRAVGEREQAHPATRRLMHLRQGTQLSIHLLGGQARMVGLETLRERPRRQRPSLPEMPQQVGRPRGRLPMLGCPVSVHVADPATAAPTVKHTTDRVPTSTRARMGQSRFRPLPCLGVIGGRPVHRVRVLLSS